MATRKEEKQFEKEMKAAKIAKKKAIKASGIKPDLSPEERRYNRNRAMSSAIWPIFRFFILFGLCFIILYPLIFMISTAFRPNEQMSDPSIIWIPKSLTLDNIKQTAEVMNYGTTIFNTVKLNIIASLLSVVSCALTGYGFARFKFKGKGILFAIVVLMIIVPPQITSIPLFLQFSYFKGFGLVKLFTGKATISLINNSVTMYAPALFANGIKAGLFIFIFRQFFRGLPKELEDAAYLDGCGPLRTFVKVMAPNAASSFLTVFLFSIVWYWNDYYVSTSFFTNNETMALTLKILDRTLQAQLFENKTVSPRQLVVWMQSGCLLSITPILVLYTFLQRYFIEGVSRSGLVG
ncbi:MAG: carbohydrate ABC transporter permease [Clostridiales bacterium]|nr:carbohydrate ABC transporter permease [Clostridiales bacterium]